MRTRASMKSALVSAEDVARRAEAAPVGRASMKSALVSAEDLALGAGELLESHAQ